MTMGGPLRFCMLTTFYPPYSFGGDGIFVEQLSRELADQGHHVTVVHCIDTFRLLAGHEPTGGQTPHPNINVIGLRSRAGFLSPLITQQMGRPGLKAGKLQAVLEQGFDVINFHNISLVGGPGLLELAARLSKSVKLYTLHEYWLVCPTHTLFKFRRHACQKRQCLVCTLSYRRPPQLWRYTGLIQRAVRYVDTFITPDHFTANQHRQMGLELPTRYIPHFVPYDATASEPPHSDLPAAAKEGDYFLFVGRLERLKGLQTLIPLLAKMPHARLLIAGTGEYESALQRLSAHLSNVVFLGHCVGPTLRALYHHAIGVIVPSINYEVAPPLVIMESFREATPVIVRNLGANPEPVMESGGGIIYETDEQLMEAMNRLQSEGNHRRELGHLGRKALTEKWSAEQYLRRYFTLIDEISEHKSL